MKFFTRFLNASSRYNSKQQRQAFFQFYCKRSSNAVKASLHHITIMNIKEEKHLD